jgi:hypothetical protein
MPDRRVCYLDNLKENTVFLYSAGEEKILQNLKNSKIKSRLGQPPEGPE